MGWFDQEHFHWVDLDLVRAMSTNASAKIDMEGWAILSIDHDFEINGYYR